MAKKIVKCKYCGQSFDKETVAHVLIPAGSLFRHAHSECYLRERAKNPKTPEYEIIDPQDIVKCAYCKKEFNKRKIPCKQLDNGKYVHLECAQLEEKREKTDEELLNAYIMELYHVPYVPPRMQKQIKQYIKEYNYTYSGMLKTLKYFYEVKGNDIKDSYESLGIIPYVYRKARDYYLAIWEAQQKNARKNINDYVETEVKVIKIPLPERKIKKRRLFVFLDEEE